MKLPRHTARVPAAEPSTARATDISALTRTSEAAKWRGVSAAAGALRRGAGTLFDIYQDRQAIDDSIEWGTATQRAQGRFRLATEEAKSFDVTMDMPLPDDPDYLKTLTSFSTAKRDELLANSLKSISKDVGELSSGFSSPENKARFENWYGANYTAFAETVRGVYAAKLDSYQRAELNKLRLDAIENKDVESADFFANIMDRYELVTPETAEKFKRENKELVEKNIYDEMKEDILNIAFGLIPERGVEAAIAWVNDKKNTPDLIPRDRFQLVGYIKQQAELNEYIDYEAATQELSENVDGLVGLFLNNKHVGREVKLLKSTELQGRWNKIAEGQGSIVRKTNKKKYIDLEERIFDFWKGKINSTELKTQLLEARAVDKSLTDGDLRLLLDRARTPPDPNTFGLLEHGFDTIRRHGAASWSDKGWGWWLSKKAEAAITSDEEADIIASARQAFITWLKAQKKEPTPEDVYKQSLAIIALHRKSETAPALGPEEKPPGEVGEPKTQEEFLRQLRIMTREEKDPNKPKSRAYYNKWMEKFPWTYWGP